MLLLAPFGRSAAITSCAYCLQLARCIGASPPAEPLHSVIPNATENPDTMDK